MTLIMAAFAARSFEGWYNVCWRVSCYFPGITLLVLTVLNLLIHHTGSSGAIPLGAFFSLVSLWFVVSIPLCYSGAPLSPPSSLTSRLRLSPATLSQESGFAWDVSAH